MMRAGAFFKKAKKITAAVMILFMCSSFVAFADDETAADPDAQASAKSTADAAGPSEGSSGDGSSASTGGSSSDGASSAGSDSSSGSSSGSDASSGTSSTGSDSGDGATPSNADDTLVPTSSADPADPKASMNLLSSAPTGFGDNPADEDSDDPAAPTKPVPEDSSADKIPAVPKVTLLNYANWDGPSGDYSVDENGNVIIENFLISQFEPGAYTTESFVIMLGDTVYSFTISSDGFIIGELPEGFTISGRNLMISGINEDLEMTILEQTALSSTFEEPYFEEPSFEDADIKAPDKTKTPAPIKIKNNGTSGSKTTAIPFVASVDAMSIEPSVVDPAHSAPKNSDQASVTNTRGIGENSSPSPFKGFHPVEIIILMLTVGGMIIVPKFIL